MANTISLRTVQEHVRKSALKLDAELPGWYRHVNLNRLQMGNTEQCICGQLVNAGLNVSNIKSSEGFSGYYMDIDRKRGFYLPDHEYHMGNEVLGRLWRRQIRKRLAA